MASTWPCFLALPPRARCAPRVKTCCAWGLLRLSPRDYLEAIRDQRVGFYRVPLDVSSATFEVGSRRAGRLTRSSAPRIAPALKPPAASLSALFTELMLHSSHQPRSWSARSRWFGRCPSFMQMAGQTLSAVASARRATGSVVAFDLEELRERRMRKIVHCTLRNSMLRSL